MDPRASLLVLNQARRLAEAGRFPALLEYLQQREHDAVRRSASLALLYATALGRLGRHAEGREWADAALDRAQASGDSAAIARAHNILGAIALEGGTIDLADSEFRRGRSEAHRARDYATVGRCSNNLGILANLRGRHDDAIGDYAIALAAFQQVDHAEGVILVYHNLGITYRDLDALPRALESANRAVDLAREAGAQDLGALALSGRAETRMGMGDLALARREIERAIDIRQELEDAAGEAEDRRIRGGVLAAANETDRAEAELLDVIGRARELNRPLLAASAGRDLARLLARLGRVPEARDIARTARAQFARLGAAKDIERLDTLLSQLTVE